MNKKRLIHNLVVASAVSAMTVAPLMSPSFMDLGKGATVVYADTVTDAQSITALNIAVNTADKDLSWSYNAFRQAQTNPEKQAELMEILKSKFIITDQNGNIVDNDLLDYTFSFYKMGWGSQPNDNYHYDFDSALANYSDLMDFFWDTGKGYTELTYSYLEIKDIHLKDNPDISNNFMTSMTGNWDSMPKISSINYAPVVNKPIFDLYVGDYFDINDYLADTVTDFEDEQVKITLNDGLNTLAGNAETDPLNRLFSNRYEGTGDNRTYYNEYHFTATDSLGVATTGVIRVNLKNPNLAVESDKIINLDMTREEFYESLTKDNYLTNKYEQMFVNNFFENDNNKILADKGGNLEDITDLFKNNYSLYNEENPQTKQIIGTPLTFWGIKKIETDSWGDTFETLEIPDKESILDENTDLYVPIFITNTFGSPENKSVDFKGDNYYKLVFKTENDTTPEVGYGDLTVKYQDTEGNDILDLEVQQVEVGQEYEATAKEIDGYTLEGEATIKGNMTKNGQTIVFTYKAKEVTPEEPEVPVVPETPEKPETPEVPTPEEPEVPEVVETPETEEPEIVEPEAETPEAPVETPENTLEVQETDESISTTKLVLISILSLIFSGGIIYALVNNDAKRLKGFNRFKK
ncbi:MucBP domain-containing protein [Enterococcus gallinarum]|uniref:MucBP domain-containing protein n=1 Tax=Enterococcus gallinarum TaxID=1353 RepID=UPI001CAA79C8|nr:MucBP domain-containing protein [Enterococcus gallinarum]